MKDVKIGNSVTTNAREMETVAGIIYCDNKFMFYIKS